MMQELFREVLGVQVETPFPRMTYDEAMSLYGSDKPDLRFQMTIDDYTNSFSTSKFNAFRNVIERGGVVKGLYWDKPLDRSALKVLDQAASGSGNKFCL